MGYTNSPLVSYTKLSPNHSGQRTHVIDTITPHCVVGQASVEGLGNVFAPVSRQASCQYGIGADGRVGMYCEEKNRSWCTSSNANDQRAITIECASDATHPYAFKDIVYERLIDLCVDICQRNGKNVLLWFGDKNKTLNYQPKDNEMLLTVHRWFAAKSCPGDWMYARMGDLADKVTARLSGVVPTPQPTPQPTPTPQPKDFPKTPFLVDVLVADLPYRLTPTSSVVKGYTGKGKFTITEVQGNFGKLKSGAGWIDMSNSNQVKIGSTINSGGSSGGSNPPSTTFEPYKVQVDIKNLNIRKGPGTDYPVVKVCPPNTYTIVAESDGKGATKWGKLKSGVGWISLDFVKRK